MARVLVLGASVSQLAAIDDARRSGHWLLAVDGDPAAVGSRSADAFAAVDFSDLEKLVAVASWYQVEGVLAVASDRAVLPAALVAEALSLPGISPAVAVRMTDKAAMRTTLAAAGVRQPPHTLLSDARDHVRPEVPLPAVLKPVDSGGQRGLQRIESHNQLSQLLPETLAFSASGRAILETYIEGTELNGMVVVRNGEPTLLTLSDRLRPAGRGFGVGWAHSYPSALPADALAEAKELAFAAVRALGLQNGIAFPQLIVDRDGQPWLIEIAARIAAGQMADLVRYATGINLYQVAVAQALGQPVPDELIHSTSDRPIAIRFLTADPGVLPVGIVREIDGLEAVRASPGVLAADLYFTAGHRIRPVQVDADRSGYIIATADTPTEALDCADHAATKLVVRVEPAGGDPAVSSGQ